ncbi:DUF4375 domain-containing protein [Piscinibacter sp. HJYY11]|uniref:DMP19 family protein n=1 Tax=Piscinibacter sp. HJYY11 TaxID=2801333 RepID=UPI00191FF5B1|nr:DUF4375 domain-containing protein [Piscinibacter sp. HJYY11]MBL0731210.1 DUF4375 domain-containing protein [Piscinibacter sp. HJYY11]
MDDLDYVLQVIDPWLDKYIERGASFLLPLEALGVGVWLLEAEVNNGGFHQYYFNSHGALAEQTVEALDAIGAHETAAILSAANMDVGELPLPDEEGDRIAKLDEISMSSRFSALETEFFEEREDRISLLAAYLRRAQNDA